MVNDYLFLSYDAEQRYNEHGFSRLFDT